MLSNYASLVSWRLRNRFHMPHSVGLLTCALSSKGIQCCVGTAEHAKEAAESLPVDCGVTNRHALILLQALAIFDIVRGNFSNANVFSSTFDNYTEALMEKLPDLHLPVFTEEIGDTWIYGESY